MRQVGLVGKDCTLRVYATSTYLSVNTFNFYEIYVFVQTTIPPVRWRPRLRLRLFLFTLFRNVNLAAVDPACVSAYCSALVQTHVTLTLKLVAPHKQLVSFSLKLLSLTELLVSKTLLPDKNYLYICFVTISNYRFALFSK